MNNSDEFDEDSGLVDAAAVQQILEKAQDALRPLGLSLLLDQVVVQMNQGTMVAVMPCVIRKSAKTKLVEDKTAREAFNRMMAEQHDANLAQQRADIQAMLDNPDLDEILFGGKDACPHDRRHPVEGFCLNCGKGLDP